MHIEAAAEHSPGSVLLDQLLLHVVDEVGSRALDPRQADVRRLRQRRAGGASHVALGDLALRKHHLQHLEPPGLGACWVRHGIEPRRIGGNAGEQRRLGEGQTCCAGVEVRLRGPLDSIGAVPEVDRVQICGEDPQLLPALFELPGKRRLFELAADGSLGRDARVLDELLRDGRTALYDALARDVGPHCAPDPAEVDTPVLVEALVFDRNDRLLHDRRDVGGPDEDAALGAPERGEDRVPVVRIDVPIDLTGHVRRIAGRDLARNSRDQPERERRDAEEKKDDEEGSEAELSDPPPAPVRGRRAGAAFPAKQAPDSSSAQRS